MRVDWRRRSLELTLRLADVIRGRAYKLPASLLLPPVPPPAMAGAPTSDPVKASAAGLSAVKLAAFLSSDRAFVLPTTESPEVSVLLVTFNRAELTFECLQSLCAQSLPGLEVVIVDNASTDGPASCSSGYAARPSFAAVSTHFLAGANQAARHARGNKLIF
jgi:hypothetical protein